MQQKAEPARPRGEASQAKVPFAWDIATANNCGKRFKSKLCKYWLDEGRCFFREKCTYAHGQEELT